MRQFLGDNNLYTKDFKRERGKEVREREK